MNKASVPVLELLYESDLALPGGTIAVNLERNLDHAPSRATVFRALDPLEEHGYIREIDAGESAHYEITEAGAGFLRDE